MHAHARPPLLLDSTPHHTMRDCMLHAMRHSLVLNALLVHPQFAIASQWIVAMQVMRAYLASLTGFEASLVDPSTTNDETRPYDEARMVSVLYWIPLTHSGTPSPQHWPQRVRWQPVALTQCVLA